MRKLENERISKWGGLRNSEENGGFQKRRVGEILVKKGCKEGGVSL